MRGRSVTVCAMTAVWIVVAAQPLALQIPARRASPSVSSSRHVSGVVHLVAVGDIMLAGRMGDLMRKKGRDYPFALMRPTLRGADIAFGNLECCIATQGQPLDKKFTFQAKPEAALAVHEAGFAVVSLANNHAWDFGREALLETVRRVRQTGVVAVGAGANRADAHALRIINRNGLRIGFLAYLGLAPPLLPESDSAPCLAMGSASVIEREVKAARSRADVLIVSMHCGHENDTTPTAFQRTLAHAAIDAGADMVIGHHPHVVQPMETYKGKPICYSLGNFVFSVTGRGTGALLDATLYPNGHVIARLRPLQLAAQTHFPKPGAQRKRASRKHRR